jgi:hypothetical protein
MSGGDGVPADPRVTVDDTLDRGRAAFDRRAWADAQAHLTAADRKGMLAPEDVERLATVDFLTGRDDDAAEIWERAYRGAAARADHAGAARCAFWLAFGFLNRGEVARGTGWSAKARRQLDQTQRECAEQGYLSMLETIQQADGNDHASALAAADAAVAVGERCGDADLVALARSVRGRMLVRQGKAHFNLYQDRPCSWMGLGRGWHGYSSSQPVECASSAGRTRPGAALRRPGRSVPDSC